MGKAEFAKQEQSQQTECGNPQCKECFAVEDVPSVSQVGNREELERKGKFDEAKHHLHGVHPAARFGQAVEQRREHGKDAERNGKSQGKREHTHSRADDVALACRFNEQSANDGTGARERHQSQGECHEEYAKQTGGFLGS